MIKELLALAVVGLIIYFLFTLLKRVLLLAINSIIGIFVLIIFNTVFSAGITINFWSVIITALGGVVGFLIVLGLHYLGWAF